MASLDAHARPPASIRDRYKRHQKPSLKDLDLDPDVFDAERQNFAGCIESSFTLPQDLGDIFRPFLNHDDSSADAFKHQPLLAYEHPRVPGRFTPLTFVVWTSH